MEDEGQDGKDVFAGLLLFAVLVAVVAGAGA